MPIRMSYLGKLGPEGKLDWGGSWTGNIPAAGHILPDNNDITIYQNIKEHACRGDYEGDQVDWGAYAIKVNGPDLLNVLSECYGDLRVVDPNSLKGRYVNYAETLGSNHYVAFIATEL